MYFKGHREDIASHHIVWYSFMCKILEQKQLIWFDLKILNNRILELLSYVF